MAVLGCGIMYTTVQGVYLTFLINKHRVFITSQSKAQVKAVLVSIVVMVSLDWVALCGYIYNYLNFSGYQYEQGRAITVSLGGWHCALAAYNFSKFRLLATRDLKSDDAANQKKRTEETKK